MAQVSPAKTDMSDAMLPIIQEGSLANLHPFPRLPIELMLKICGVSANNQESRVIEFIRRTTIPKMNEANASDYFYINTTCPVILHVCQESRKEALKVYELLDIDQKEHPQSLTFRPSDYHHPRYSPKIKFSSFRNFGKDVSYLSRHILLSKLVGGTTHRTDPSTPFDSWRP